MSRERLVEEIVMAEVQREAKRTIRRICALMALEKQTEGRRGQDELIEDLANEIMREIPRGIWKCA